jgi:hypothetical protein
MLYYMNPCKFAAASPADFIVAVNILHFTKECLQEPTLQSHRVSATISTHYEQACLTSAAARIM